MLGLSGCATPQADGATPAATGTPPAQGPVAAPPPGSGASPLPARPPAGRSAQANGAPTAPRALPHSLSGDDDGELPAVELTPQIVYQLLAADIAIQRGDNGSAYATYMSLAKATRDPRIARRAAEVAIGARALDEALAATQLWHELAPKSQSAAQMQETLWLSAGRLKDVEPLLAARLAGARTDGTLPAAYAQLQRALQRVPDRAAAWALMQRVSAPDLGVASARLARASVAASAEDFAAASSEAREAMRLQPDSEDAVVAAARYTQRLPDGTKSALELLERYLQRVPMSLEARYTYARLLLGDGQTDRAREQFERSLAQSPNSPAVLFSLAQIAHQNKQPADAEKYLRRYVELPRSVPRDNGIAYLFLAQIAEEGNRTDEALDWLSKVPPGDEYIPAVARRALLMGKSGRVDAARELLQNTPTTSTRESVQLLSAESQLLREAKRNQESFDVLAQGLERYPGNPELLYDHAMAAERLDRVAVMESSLRTLIELRPDSAHAYNALGYTFADRSIRLDEARTLIEKALTLAPDDAHILDSMGWVLFRQKDYAGALAYLRKAYALRPEADIAAHLGEVLWALGNVEEAKKYWREARGKEPDNTTLRETLARLNVAL